MIRRAAALVSVALLALGINILVSHQAWLDERSATLTKHSGRVAGAPRYHPDTDVHEPFARTTYSSMDFYLEGEHWEYSVILPRGDALARRKFLRKGDVVKLSYVSLDFAKQTKRRVWQLAVGDSPPLFTAQQSRSHTDHKNTSAGYGTIGMGLAMLVWLFKTRATTSSG